MALFSSRLDTPVDVHQKALNDEISRLEKEIAALRLGPRKTFRNSLSRLQPSASAHASTSAAADPFVNSGLIKVTISEPLAVPPVPLPPTMPLGLKPLPLTLEPSHSAPVLGASFPLIETPLDPRFNELGVRKFDLGSWYRNLLARIRQHTVGTTSNNPHMIKYLATGSVQGLRPLRYERRVARNRLLALVATLVVVLYGLAWVFLRGHSP